MTPPLLGLPALGDLGGLLAALALGLFFGAFLEQAGLGSARKLVGQFYLTDLTVFKVMFSAIITSLLGVFWLSRVGVLDFSRLFVPPTFLAPHLGGGIVIGVGLVVAGLCPGTSCVAASSGRKDGLAVAAGMLCGIVMFNEAFTLVEGLYRSTPLGTVTLPEALGLPYGVVLFGVVAAGLLGFVAAEALERRHRA